MKDNSNKERRDREKRKKKTQMIKMTMTKTTTTERAQVSRRAISGRCGRSWKKGGNVIENKSMVRSKADKSKGNHRQTKTIG